MIIEVKQKHIDEGVAIDCGRCPVALALNEATKKEWIISNRWMCYKDCDQYPGFGWSEDTQVPPTVADNIRKFDVDGIMEPFSFEIQFFGFTQTSLHSV